MGDRTPVHTLTSYLGLISSVLSMVLGIVHVCNVRARIHWPEYRVIDDVQKYTWRMPLFTFTPDIFLDVWTPFFFGLIGTMAHISNFAAVRRMTHDYIHYLVFLLIQGLFANIGYDGGLGIIVSAVTFAAALFALVGWLMDKEAPAHLALQIGVKIERPPRS